MSDEEVRPQDVPEGAITPENLVNAQPDDADDDDDDDTENDEE